jgi:hypothetical protein
VRVLHDEARVVVFLDRPRRRETAGWHRATINKVSGERHWWCMVGRGDLNPQPPRSYSPIAKPDFSKPTQCRPTRRSILLSYARSRLVVSIRNWRNIAFPIRPVSPHNPALPPPGPAHASFRAGRYKPAPARLCALLCTLGINRDGMAVVLMD